MDTAWIPVFVLTISECVAPSGKTVCQQQELAIEFVDEAQCELALEQLVSLKQGAENVIVDADSARCVRSARQREVYSSIDEINARFGDAENWRAPAVEKQPPDFSIEAHQKRLANLDTCENTGGAAPCKVGEIIVEGPAEQSLDVWRRDQ